MDRAWRYRFIPEAKPSGNDPLEAQSCAVTDSCLLERGVCKVHLNTAQPRSESEGGGFPHPAVNPEGRKALVMEWEWFD